MSAGRSGTAAAHPFSVDPFTIRQWAGTLDGPVIVPTDDAFDSARLVWNRAIDVQPLAVVRCAGLEDVVRTIDFARTQEVPVAIRSGGHSQAGHGTCDGGIVVDLGSFRSVGVDDTGRVARVAAGARVSDVMDATQRYGLLTPMGGCPDVGVGGLTLGGGENFLMAKYGAVCDNLRAARVVTVDGRVLTASDQEHPDLFWALRGGSGNFGVVTSFEYRLYPIREVLAGQLVFPIRRAAEVMRRYRDLMQSAPDELTTSGGLSPIPNGPMFFLHVCYCGDQQQGQRLLDGWLSALKPEKDTIEWGPYQSELSVPAAASVGTGRFLPELTDEVIEAFVSALVEAPAAASAVWNDLHGAVTRVALDETAFPLRHPGFDLFLSVPWTTDEERDGAIAWSSALSRALAPFSRGVYVNNLNETESDRVREAFGPHYTRLAAIKKRYDPDNFFRVNHNIKPRG
jgi:FAD/FMN-containing dehydrogenase